MQHQKLPPEALEALDAEAWFRERLTEEGQGGPASRTGSRAKPSKEALFDEAIEWFLDQPATTSVVEWPKPSRHWPKVTFWVSDDLIGRCERLAREHRLARSQIISLALRRYCARRIPEELVAFRREAFQGARALYRRLQAPIQKRRRSPSRR